MAPEGRAQFEKRALEIGGVSLFVLSHRVGSRWVAKVETADVGNSIGRGSGESREQAEEAALDSARMVLDVRSAAAAFRDVAGRFRS